MTIIAPKSIILELNKKDNFEFFLLNNTPEDERKSLVINGARQINPEETFVKNPQTSQHRKYVIKK